MNTPFIIYIRAVGIYALLTLPALFLPIMYIISIMYVLFYGWFAWAVFTMFYLVTTFCNPSYYVKMGILTIAVVVAVLFAFQMLEVLNVEENIWYSGSFLLFPVTAIFSGWISLNISKEKIKNINREMLLNFPEQGIPDEKISK
jgi:hypothetical protein